MEFKRRDYIGAIFDKFCLTFILSTLSGMIFHFSITDASSCLAGETVGKFTGIISGGLAILLIFRFIFYFFEILLKKIKVEERILDSDCKLVIIRTKFTKQFLRKEIVND